MANETNKPDNGWLKNIVTILTAVLVIFIGLYARALEARIIDVEENAKEDIKDVREKIYETRDVISREIEKILDEQKTLRIEQAQIRASIIKIETGQENTNYILNRLAVDLEKIEKTLGSNARR